VAPKVVRRAALQLKLNVAKRSFRDMYRELLANQSLPPERLHELTEKRAADMAGYAYDNSEFYRELYTAAGLTRADLRDPGAFASLPIIDRSVMKGNYDRIKSASVDDRHARLALTSGSTGQPMRTWNDARVPMQPISWRMYAWWGIDPDDDVVHIGRWFTSRRATIAAAASWWPTRVSFIHPGKLDDEVITDLVTTVNKHRPPLIEGYVGALYEIARYVDRHHLDFAAPRAIGTTAAPLTPEVRTYIQDVLGAPVHDQYRCSEVPWMAGECGRRDGLHVFSDLRRIEVVDDAGNALPPGEAGNIVVTDLANRVFPLVRYRLGDRGSLRAGACPCGITLPLMDSPGGRTIDMLRLPDGTVLAGGVVSIFDGVPTSVRRFRLHQNADYSIDIEVALGDSPSAQQDVEAVVENFRDRVRHQVTVRWTAVADFPYTGGKLKYVTSDVPPP
jgi:phenylacetate-CoA ligase